MYPYYRRENPPLQTTTVQEARANRMLGPVYHGTSSTREEVIRKEGFAVWSGVSKDKVLAHEYPVKSKKDYILGIPPPVHFYGYAYYFVLNPRHAEDYAYSTTPSGEDPTIMTCYLTVPRLLTVNVKDADEMMRWWIANGYNYAEQAKKRPVYEARSLATLHMTEHLSSRYDAVLTEQHGDNDEIDEGLKELQIAVYDSSNIYRLNEIKSSRNLAVGDVVEFRRRRKYRKGMFILPSLTARGRVVSKTLSAPDPERKTKYEFVVAWDGFGTHGGYTESDILPESYEYPKIVRSEDYSGPDRWEW